MSDMNGDNERDFKLMYVFVTDQSQHETVVMEFDNSTESRQWTTEVEALKTYCQSIPTGTTIHEMKMWRLWLQKCKKFSDKWGCSRVPIDIRNCVNDCRVNGFNMPPIQFEE